MQRCATSTGSAYISGQPPTIGTMPCSRHSRTASSDTLPCPNDRWNQTCVTPCAAHHGRRGGRRGMPQPIGELSPS